MFNCEHIGSILFKWKCNLIDATVPGRWEIWGEKVRNPAASQKNSILHSAALTGLLNLDALSLSQNCLAGRWVLTCPRGSSYLEGVVLNILCWVTHHCYSFLQGFTSYLAREQSCSSFQRQHLFFAQPGVSAQNKHKFQPSQVQSPSSHMHCSVLLKLYRKTATTFQSAISAHHNLSRLQKKCSKLQRFTS